MKLCLTLNALNNYKATDRFPTFNTPFAIQLPSSFQFLNELNYSQVSGSRYRYCFYDSTSNDSLCIDLRDPRTVLSGRRRPPLAVSSKFNPKTLQFDGRLVGTRIRVPFTGCGFVTPHYPHPEMTIGIEITLFTDRTKKLSDS